MISISAVDTCSVSVFQQPDNDSKRIMIDSAFCIDIPFLTLLIKLIYINIAFIES